MGHSYTPGLTVTGQTIVRRRRMLPLSGTVRVQLGEEVAARQVVAQTSLPGKVYPINVANQLGIVPDEIPDYVTRRIGEAVEREAVIAENKPLFRWLKTEITSPIRGTVESISSLTGQMLIREPPLVLDLLAYVDGRIAEIHGCEGVTVETSCALVQGIFGLGGERWGTIALGVSAPDEPLTPDRLTADMRGCVVVGGAFVSFETMQLAKDLGVQALIVGGVHDQDIRALLGYDLGVAITGNEPVGFTLVLTEGFGHIPMADRTFGLLSRLVGAHASVSGATQIRAGVMRPEVIIPHPGSVASGVGTQALIAKEGLTIGDQVRIIRDPWFGKIGRVAELPSDARPIATESLARVLVVSFHDGSRAVVPRSNVEAIEG
ncbi:hypothetical protein YTPLAS18_23250 [Nitrospira sp.]|nr:hypothetical protein YTPLAS18_23250 [Nitrospira sp.]